MAREVKAKREKGFQTFAVLFDVLNEQTARESRFIASLDEMMTFISFAGPGKNLVRAIVVYSRRDIREIKADFLDKHRNRRYHNYAMFSDGFAFSKEAVIEKVGRFHCQMLPESEITDMEVIVPEKFFAKKPPRWLWNFVNHYFTGKPFEQCDFRRKALYAIPFGIIVMPIEIIATTFLKIFAALACALFGLRNVYMEQLFTRLPQMLKMFLTKPRCGIHISGEGALSIVDIGTPNPQDIPPFGRWLRFSRFFLFSASGSLV